MRVSRRRWRASDVEGGFSLLETVIAAGLLLAAVTAVTFVVVGVTRGGAGLESRMDQARAMQRVAERLRALSFCAGCYPQATPGADGEASDLVAAVFPHADLSRTTASARYVAVAAGGGEDAGSFVTLFDDDGVEVRCAARFLTGQGGVPLGPDALVGWDASAAAAPPSAILSVVLSSADGGPVVSFVRSALSNAPVAVPTPAAT